MSTTRLAPARRLWRGGGHVGVVGAAKLGSDLEATNRAVGVSGSAHTKAALARGRDAVVEGDASVVEADVEERRLLGVNDGGLAQDGLRRRRLVQEAVGGRQEQGSYEISLRFGATFSEGTGVTAKSPRRRLGRKVHRGCFAALSGAGANLSRRSWEQVTGNVNVYIFVRWQLARRIFKGYIPAFSTKN